jgi:ribulose-phosphate 3-epimerase
LAADFSDLRAEIASLEQAGADLFHLDIMDGHFVPNLTFGPVVVSAVRQSTALVLDAHLMISRPDRYLAAFQQTGIEALTIHVEAEAPLATTLAEMAELGLRRGLSLNPATDLAQLHPYLDQLDLVLVMAVQPGFGGQTFQPLAVDKIGELNELRRKHGYTYAISVDGGIDDRTAPACRDAGADILVSGTYLLHATDRKLAVRYLRGTE